MSGGSRGKRDLGSGVGPGSRVGEVPGKGATVMVGGHRQGGGLESGGGSWGLGSGGPRVGEIWVKGAVGGQEGPWNGGGSGVEGSRGKGGVPQ